MQRLSYFGKVVVITGASSGIGKAIAFKLIKKYGCTVYALARNEKRLNDARAELCEYGDKYIAYSLDASSKQSWLDFAEFLQKSSTRVDILINCAGVLPKFQNAQNATIEEFESAIEINYLSQVYGCKILLPLINEKGAIVNVSSASALCPFALVSAYSASKAASERFSECLSHELKSIRVSTVMPGFVRTDIMKNQDINPKEARLIRKFSADCDKTVNKILSRVRRRKRRIVVGADAHFMSFLYRTLPRTAPKLISAFLKKSGLELFND